MKVEFDASEFVPPVVTGEWEQVQPGLFRAKDQDGKFVHMQIDMGSDDGGRNTEDLPTATGSMMTLVDSKEALKKFDCIEDPLIYTPSPAERFRRNQNRGSLEKSRHD